jgi:hypothetical protein
LQYGLVAGDNRGSLSFFTASNVKRERKIKVANKNENDHKDVRHKCISTASSLRDLPMYIWRARRLREEPLATQKESVA